MLNKWYITPSTICKTMEKYLCLECITLNQNNNLLYCCLYIYKKYIQVNV